MIAKNLVPTEPFTADATFLSNAWIIQQVKPKIFVGLGQSQDSYFSYCQAVFEAGISTHCYAVNAW